MTKRIKKVFKSSELCHVFNSQSQSDGRTSSGNLYFEGNKIWSYGSHYLLGQILAKQNAVLINNHVYSPTTRGHIADLENATSDRLQFNVPVVHDPKDPRNLEYFQNKVLDKIDSILSCRANTGRGDVEYYATATLNEVTGKNEYRRWNASLVELIEDLNEFCDTFKIKNDLKVPSEFIQELIDIAKANDLRSLELKAIRDAKPQSEKDAEAAKRLAIREAKEANERAEREAKDNAKRLAWSSGTGNEYPMTRSGNVVLRIKDNEVQTSFGARVPLPAARQLFMAIENGLPVVGQKIGHYEVDSVTDDCINIGCHCIPRDEARRVLGVL